MDIPINRTIVHHGADNYRLTESILLKLRDKPVETIDHESFPEGEMPVDMDKETLRLIDFKGELLKPCPGTKGYICCGYQILHVGTNCPLDCSYCILQAYFNQPSLRIFVNLEEELLNVGKILDSHPEKIFRIGTGEFTDSLALDHLAGWSKSLPEFFISRKNVLLELKTKTDNIDGLLSSPYRERIVVSWSLNSDEIAAKEEHGAPSIIKRIKSAKKCQEQGFIVGLHFDPLIHYPGWEKGYLKILELLYKYIDPKKVIWVSMGCLRYMPVLKSIIRKRHRHTRILDGEFINGLDGKKRYFKPIRIDMYSLIKEHLDEWYNDLGIYLCMESHDVWQSSLGWSPRDSKGLSDYLDKRVIKLFPN